MNEKNYWYAALENAEDDWFRGSIDLDVEERYRMWQNNKMFIYTCTLPHNAMADSLMEDISLFMEENTEAEIIDEEREIRQAVGFRI